MKFAGRGVRVLGVLLGIATLVGAGTIPAGAGEMQSGEPIKVGMTILTTPAFGFAPRVAGVEAGVRALNKRGGINGREVEFVLCEATNANEGEECARRMVDEGVVVTLNDANFAAEIAANEILANGGIAQIDPFTNTKEARNAPNTFFLDGGITAEYVGLPQYMKKKKIKTIQYLVGDTESSDNVTSQIDVASEHYGTEVKGSTRIPLAAADYTPYVTDAASADADINIFVMAPFQTNLFLQAGQQLGQDFLVGGVEGQLNLEQYEEFGGSGGVLEDSILLGVVPPVTATKQFPELKRFKREMAAEFKAGNEAAKPETLTSQQVRSWLTLQAFEAVAEGLDDITAATVMEGFNTAKDLDLGLIPPWTPSATGPPGYTRASNPFSWVITVKGGKPLLAQKKPLNTLIPFEE